MIISDDHRYLFVEQPHTACTAIHEELVRFYGGREILYRHATYAMFLRTATPEQKRYFTFSGIRNPLDERVSMYFKYRTNHAGQYTRPTAALADRQRQIYEYVGQEHGDFAGFLRRFHRRPYDNDTLIYHSRMDALIRYEHLQDDFARVLGRLGLEKVRPLPIINKTEERGGYLDYYPPEIRAHAVRTFGPFMEKWGYELPDGWGRVPRASRLGFRVLGVFRYTYRRYLQLGPLDRQRRPGTVVTRAARTITRPIARAMYRLFGL